jgi:electron transport complex protein RnfB
VITAPRIQAAAPAALAASVDALLPQTQCTRCGYAGCRPYADAIAGGAAPINQCPPGGAQTIRALAGLLGVPVQPLNPVHGCESAPVVAWIDEARCIGCARCLAPCPVDAIVGAPKHVHTVIADHCTGCELCIAPCPVDCIEIRPASRAPGPDANRARYEAHLTRLRVRADTRRREIEAKKAAAPRRADGR